MGWCVGCHEIIACVLDDNCDISLHVSLLLQFPVFLKHANSENPVFIRHALAAMKQVLGVTEEDIPMIVLSNTPAYLEVWSIEALSWGL